MSAFRVVAEPTAFVCFGDPGGGDKRTPFGATGAVGVNFGLARETQRAMIKKKKNSKCL